MLENLGTRLAGSWESQAQPIPTNSTTQEGERTTQKGDPPQLELRIRPGTVSKGLLREAPKRRRKVDPLAVVLAGSVLTRVEHQSVNDLI